MITKTIFLISFDGTWTDCEKFNEVFEFVDSAGCVRDYADENTVGYSFKSNKINWEGVDNISGMFHKCRNLIMIELPPTNGKIKNASNLFRKCEYLKKIIFTDDWNDIDKIENVFYGCDSLADKYKFSRDNLLKEQIEDLLCDYNIYNYADELLDDLVNLFKSKLTT